jgi:hypothetical protein
VPEGDETEEKEERAGEGERKKKLNDHGEPGVLMRLMEIVYE